MSDSEAVTGTWKCPWCAETEVDAPGKLCAQCEQEPDAVEFKAAHDAQCSCVIPAATTSTRPCCGQPLAYCYCADKAAPQPIWRKS